LTGLSEPVDQLAYGGGQPVDQVMGFDWFC